ncbi:hypothetical protein SDC9_194094 [bioreactor metagenome]|uniref:Uncharacterized protein n=1 Tax=bioreactor metagenome TaxID=1076179 RepID=A0A645I5I1_9ZZZZ
MKGVSQIDDLTSRQLVQDTGMIDPESVCYAGNHFFFIQQGKKCKVGKCIDSE